jgi:hypothetical protein
MSPRSSKSKLRSSTYSSWVWATTPSTNSIFQAQYHLVTSIISQTKRLSRDIERRSKAHKPKDPLLGVSKSILGQRGKSTSLIHIPTTFKWSSKTTLAHSRLLFCRTHAFPIRISCFHIRLKSSNYQIMCSEGLTSAHLQCCRLSLNFVP